MAILFGALPIATSADNEEDFEFYGRSYLATHANGEELVKAYDIVSEGIEDRLDNIDLEHSVSKNADELALVMEAYFNDPTGHFWIDQGYSFASYPSTGYVAYLLPVYNSLAGKNEDDLEKNIDVFEAACEEILKKAGIRDDMTEYEKERRIHDALVTRVIYSEAENAHNAYGAAVGRVAVCQGYTLAFDYLLRLVGIQSYVVHGMAGYESHCWSLVRIDGEYYQTDVTWADPVGEEDTGMETDIFYSYFDIPDDRMFIDHAPGPSAVILPQCTATAAGYYVHNPQCIFSSDMTPKDMADLVKYEMIRVRVDDKDFNDFQNWLSENIYDLFSLAGYDLTQPLSYKITYLSEEYHLFLIGTRTEPDIPEVTYKIGDLNGDGSVDAKDSNILLRIIAGSAAPTDVQKITGDINGDGELNAKDSNLMKRILAGSLIV